MLLERNLVSRLHSVRTKFDENTSELSHFYLRSIFVRRLFYWKITKKIILSLWKLHFYVILELFKNCSQTLSQLANLIEFFHPPLNLEKNIDCPCLHEKITQSSNCITLPVNLTIRNNHKSGHVSCMEKNIKRQRD